MLTPDSHGSSCGLIDLFGRQVRYLRLSVTDRCDLRCVYCMSEHMAFMPRKDLLVGGARAPCLRVHPLRCQ
jgi:molybdenum cofactor biosynthesis enzyme MoaA